MQKAFRTQACAVRGAEAASASASVRAQDAVQPAVVLLASWSAAVWEPASVARGAVKHVARQLQKPRLPTSRRQHSPPQWTASAVGAEASAASAGQLALPGSAFEQLAWAAAATVAVWEPASSALVVVLVPASRASWPGGAGPSAVFAEQLASPGSASEQLAWAAAAAVAAWVPASVPAVRPWTSAIVPGRWRGGEYELRKRRGVACVGMQECRRAWVPWNRRESWPAWPSSRLKPWVGRRERTPGNCRGRGAASVPQACGMIAVQPCRSLWRLAS